MATCLEELKMPPKGHKFNLSTTIHPQVILRMDDYRRNISRSRIVEMALIEYLNKKEKEELREEKQRLLQGVNVRPEPHQAAGPRNTGSL